MVSRVHGRERSADRLPAPRLTALSLLLTLAGCSAAPSSQQNTAEGPGRRDKLANQLSVVSMASMSLAQADRFHEVPEGHTLRPVQDALNLGDVDGALRLLADRNAVDAADRPMKDRLVAAIQKASDEQVGQSAGGRYAERVATYWLPDAEALPTGLPDDDEAFRKVQNKLSELTKNLEEGKTLNLSNSDKKFHQRLANALSVKQAHLYPNLRKYYAKSLDTRLFQRDIRVTTEGRSATTLLVTGGVFSFNAAIEDMQKLIAAPAANLRFKTVSYRWSASIDERTTYTLDAKGDGVVEN